MRRLQQRRDAPVRLGRSEKRPKYTVVLFVLYRNVLEQACKKRIVYADVVLLFYFGNHLQIRTNVIIVLCVQSYVYRYTYIITQYLYDSASPPPII